MGSESVFYRNDCQSCCELHTDMVSMCFTWGIGIGRLGGGGGGGGGIGAKALSIICQVGQRSCR